MSDLHRLVYYSRNRIVGDADTLAEAIKEILEKSRANNQEVGVTGALMFNAGCFAQVLEGARDAVEDVFERIQLDDRHGDVTLLGFEPAPRRAFEVWSMGFVGASVEEATHYSSSAGLGMFDPSCLSGDALFDTLYRLALEEEHV